MHAPKSGTKNEKGAALIERNPSNFLVERTELEPVCGTRIESLSREQRRG
jgi:hypothetical protein